MLRTFLIRNLLSADKKTKKKLKFISELGIFLVLAALISSGISIFYENKLNLKKSEVIKLELEEFKIQEWLTDAPNRNLENKIGKFNFDIIENNNLINISKKRYYFYLLGWYPFTIKYAIDDINSVTNEELKIKYDFENIKKTNQELIEYIYEIIDRLPSNDDQYLTQHDINEIENIFNNIPLDDIVNRLDQSEYNTLQINLFFQEYNSIVDKEKENITKQIIAMTDKSTNAILYAFIFQLIIFTLVQVFELREIS